MSNYEYEVKVPNVMPQLIMAAAKAIGEVAEVEVSQSPDGDCTVTLYRESFHAVSRREDRADVASASFAGGRGPGSASFAGGRGASPAARATESEERGRG